MIWRYFFRSDFHTSMMFAINGRKMFDHDFNTKKSLIFLKPIILVEPFQFIITFQKFGFQF